MKLQSIASLFPDVTTNGDRLVYYVVSRSGDDPRRVDKEKRMGLGVCDCPAAEKGGNHDCYHIRRVNAYMACEEAQRQMKEALKNHVDSKSERGED